MEGRPFAVKPLAFTLGATGQWATQQTALLAISALLLLWAFERFDLDLQITRHLFDPELGIFPLRRSWFLEAVMHKGAKQANTLLVAAALVLCWEGWAKRLAWLPPRNALLAAIGMLAIPAVTTFLKQHTYRYCPWDIVDFGGYAPYLHLFDAAPQGIKAGKCFPAGHASVGFLWIVWAVALRPAGRRAARLGLFAALLAGGVLGAVRLVQGAHFLSHTLWTLWVAWAVSVTIAVAVGADVRLGSGIPACAGSGLERGPSGAPRG